jgi:CRP/FNR family transcriptional regulator
MLKLKIEQFIKVFPFFRNSPEKLIEDILSLSRHAFASRDTLMQSEGQHFRNLELMMSGEKRIYKASPTGREITLYEIGRGEACVVNAACVLSDTLSPVNAMAITDVSYLVIPAEDFRSLLSTYEEMRTFVFGAVSQRLVTILELINEIVFKQMDERLFDYLVEKSQDGAVSMTHQQIANSLGTAREVVSRLLKDFEKEGKIVLSRGQVRLIAPYYKD